MSGDFISPAPASAARGRAAPEDRWTIRPSLEPNAAHVTAAVHGDGLASLQFRRAASGTTEEVKSRDSLPDPDAVVQLERRDGAYLMSVARFGDTLVTQQLTDVSLPDTVYVGLFVCAHNDTTVERATFSNVRITTPAKRDFVPYRDYIGSNREILDVASGNATIVHQYRGSFQAPTGRNGKALIYAQEGGCTASTSHHVPPPRSTPESRRATTTTTSSRSMAACWGSATTRRRTAGRRSSTRCRRPGARQSA
jgi:hypothetical protein